MIEMEEQEFESIMREHNIRPTAVRRMIYNVVADAPGLLSALDIEIVLDTVDRSTITRTLSLFHSAGLIHLIDDGTGTSKYEVCHSHNHDNHESHSDMHPHFHCRKCGRTLCLSEQSLPTINLPEGYIGEGMNLTVSGLCRACASKPLSR